MRVFENGVLRNVIGPKRDEVSGDWRRLLNGELYDVYVYYSANIIRVSKSKRIR